MKRIAITGAAGGVGSGLRRELLGRGYALRLLDIQPINDCAANEDAAVVDICHQARLTTLLDGCDAVIHLAACTTDAPWPDQVRHSVEGTISLFDAARAVVLVSLPAGLSPDELKCQLFQRVYGLAAPF